MRRRCRQFVLVLATTATAALCFAPNASAGILDQEQLLGTVGCSFADSSNSLGQTFTAGIGGQLDRVDLRLRTNNTPPNAPLTVEIRDVVGGLPGPLTLATHTLPIAEYPGATFVSAIFAAPALVIPGVQYAIVAHSAASPGSQWTWCSEFGDLYAGGKGVFTPTGPPAPGPWFDTAGEFGFRTFVTPPTTAIRTVDDDKVQCPTAGYTSIQAAVIDAGPGDEIRVCRGTYTESVALFGPGKSGIKIWSSTSPAAAVIKGSIGLFSGVTDISIERFRIEPPGGATAIQIGLPANRAHVKSIRDNLIVGGAIGISGFDSTVESLRDNYLLGQTQSGMSVVSGGIQPAVVNPSNNQVTGAAGATNPGIGYAELGGGGLTGVIFGNKVSKFVQGIQVANGTPGSAPVLKANNVFQNGVGIFINGEFGVSSAENNKATQNAGPGILVDSPGWTFLSNNANGNAGDDCVDNTVGNGTAGTANTWTGNYGLESTPPGICN